MQTALVCATPEGAEEYRKEYTLYTLLFHLGLLDDCYRDMVPLPGPPNRAGIFDNPE